MNSIIVVKFVFKTKIVVQYSLTLEFVSIRIIACQSIKRNMVSAQYQNINFITYYNYYSYYFVIFVMFLL